MSDTDELYDEAWRLVVSEQSASVSLVQRRLRIGFSRAMRLLDAMAEDGLVTRSNVNGTPRTVLVGRDYIQRVDAELPDAEPPK